MALIKNTEITNDTIREYRVEFDTVEHRAEAFRVVRQVHQEGTHRIYHAHEGLEIEYAGEVIADESRMLYIVCPSRTYHYLLREWHEWMGL
jgi:hypothetical protein